MARSGEENFDNIFKLLAEHNFQSQVKDKFKCIKCKNVLINACQSQCGCRFCRKCVDKILMSGSELCPGNTAECKSEHLSNVVPDHKMNLKISKLLVKCPEQMCGHECQLMEMEEHMRFCSKKPVQCPCHDIGCHDDDLVVDKINEHLQTDSYNHWTMLMGMIGDLRNEVRVKDDRIEAMRSEMTNEISKGQVETEMFRRQIDTWKDNLDSKIDTWKDNLDTKIDTWKVNLNSKFDAMAAQINGIIESIKMDRSELSGELSNLKSKLEGIRVEVDARLDETKRGCMGHVEEQLGLINGTMGKYQDQIAGMKVKMETGMEEKKNLATLVWHLDGVSKISISKQVRSSGYFYPKTNPCQIQLAISNNKSQLQIYLRIHATTNDANLQWPFQANVTVKVTNKSTPAACMEATKYCSIPRPPNNYYSDNSKNPFLFPIADLSSKNLLLDDCCIVECWV